MGVGHTVPNKRPILLATDGSACAARARLAAVDLCARSGAALHIVHAWGMSGSFRVVTQVGDEALNAQLQRDARALLAHEVAVAEADGAPDVHPHLVHSSPGASILFTAHRLDPAVIVMGSHGAGLLRRAFLGTVSEYVVGNGGHPVLVLRDVSPWPPRRVVVGDDGSENAHRAAILGCQIARALGIDVLLVHARVRGDEMEGVPAEEWVAERAELLGSRQGCRVESTVVGGSADDALGHVGSGTESLIVVGGRRVSTALLRGHLSLPLLVVPRAHAAWSIGAPNAVEIAR